MSAAPTFLGLIEKAYGEEPRPVTGIVELTRRCNLRCVHCYAAPERGRRELDAAGLEAVLDALARLGTLFATFIGGDPTVSPHFLRLVRRAGDLHMAIQIFTNGTLLDERAVCALEEEPVFHVAVSLYGARAQTHDRIVGHPGAWVRTTAAIRRLRERGIPVVVKFLVSRANLAEVGEMERLAAEWRVPLQVNANIAPRDDLEPGAWGARVALPDLVRLRRRRGVPPPHDVPEDRGDLRCVMGRRLVAINAYGDVFPCIMVPIPAGNVRYAPLDEIWRTSPFLRFVREFRHVERADTCGGCGYRGDCFRCPGLAYMETGDLFGPSPSACLEAVATRQARNGAGSDATDLPPGLVHADSRLWSVHDILRTAGLACVETHLEEARAGGVR